MCGITGVFNRHREEPVPASLLDRLVDTLAHRGPDDRGCLLLGPVALGARRLSIIDVPGGHQPMSTADGAVHLVYNGEIYNHMELRGELEALGHRFRTRCDTEVVLLGYRQWGCRGLAERLNGIFAFAIWDGERRIGFLCRDRLGVKPLYYVDRNGRLVFSSELRALAQCGLLRAKIQDEALAGYLLYQFTPGDRTLLAGALKLAPGHILSWRDGRSTLERYWNFPPGGERTRGDLAEQADELKALLWDAVERQMVSDVPVGCFLSGGLDSTIVASIMARLSSRPVRTYSISFPDQPACDESEHFEEVARGIAATHVTIPFSEHEVLEKLERFAWAADEPVADPAMLPTFLLAEAASRDVKVVLTGEGADEVFAGYAYYRERVEALAAARRDPGLASWKRLTGELFRRTGFMAPAPRNDLASPRSGFPYAVDPPFLWHLLAAHRRPDPDSLAGLASRVESAALAGLAGLNPLQTAAVVDTRLWLANDLMPKLDKMTMAHSLEGRVPFLDHRLVEFAFRLPADAKVGAEHGKIVLREAVRGLVPERQRLRRKQGFNVPLDVWFRGPLRAFVRETLLGSAFADLELFDRRALEALLYAHDELNFNFARPLWEVLCLGLWLLKLRAEMAADDPMTHPLELTARRPQPSSASPHRCDVVVPVYGGVNYVRDLLRTLERHTAPGSFRLLLVDDSANPATHEALRELTRDRPWATLERNPENLGFLASCNRGIALGTAPYVCLLNSDTLVSAGWLERLLAAAESDPSVGVVNPLSNKAINLSLAMPPGYDLNRLNEKVRAAARRSYPDVTTAVGFCMLIKRRFVDWLGAFDPIYGHGYCEESDLCMRYTEAGLRVVVAPDAFVYHKGCGSFGTWIPRYRKNRPIFDSRWGGEYDRDYARFLKRNPLQYLRDAVLRHTIARRHWPNAEPRRYDGELLRRRRRRSAALALDAVDGLPARAAVGGSAVLGDESAARPRTVLDPEQREVRYPTRGYLDGIPSGSGLRITFLVGDTGTSGGMTSIVQLSREFMLRGASVNMVTLSEELQPERHNLPLQPLIFPDRETLLRLFPETDVVIATFWTTAHDFLAELHRRYDMLSVYFLQDYEAYFYPETDRVNRRNVVATYGLAERRIVKSRWLRKLVESHGCPCEIVPLGLDLGIFRDDGRARALGPRPRLLSVARPHERRRGFAEVAAAFRGIHARRPEVEFVFLGASEHEMPRDLGFPYTNIGRLDDLNQVAELVRSADVLIDSSLYQAFGRPGIEAMGCGTNCVLTSEGGVTEYARHEENCLVVPPGDAEAIVGATLRLLDEPGLRDGLRAAGAATAARFCHLVEASRHLDLYRSWLAERRGARREARRGAD